MPKITNIPIITNMDIPKYFTIRLLINSPITQLFSVNPLNNLFHRKNLNLVFPVQKYTKTDKLPSKLSLIHYFNSSPTISKSALRRLQFLHQSQSFPFRKEVSGSARPLSSPGTFRPVRAPPLIPSPPGPPSSLSFPFILPARPSSPGRSPSASPSPRVCPRPRPSQAPRRPTARQTARRCTPSSCTSSKA